MMKFSFSLFRFSVSLLLTSSLLLSQVSSSEIEETPLLTGQSLAYQSQSVSAIQLENETNSLRSSRASSAEIIYKPSVSQPVQEPARQVGNVLSLGDIVNLHHSFKAKEEEPYNPYVINHIGLISSTLKIVEVAIVQKEEIILPGSHGEQEAAEMVQTVLEEPGNIQDGLFVVFESMRRPHRYHAGFYTFDEAAYKASHPVFLSEDQRKSQQVRALFHTPSELRVEVHGCLLTKTKPNKLYLSIEEIDSRCCGLGGGRILDFFGMIYSKVEADPLGAVSLVAGGASRIAKAVMTNGASELANLAGE
jgi:hypothetical protein